MVGGRKCSESDCSTEGCFCINPISRSCSKSSMYTLRASQAYPCSHVVTIMAMKSQSNVTQSLYRLPPKSSSNSCLLDRAVSCFHCSISEQLKARRVTVKTPMIQCDSELWSCQNRALQIAKDGPSLHCCPAALHYFATFAKARPGCTKGSNARAA